MVRLGKLRESVLKRAVLIPASTKAPRLLTTKKPGIDSALLRWDEDRVSVSSATEVLEFGTESALLCCIKACNNLYAAGAVPVGMQIQLLLSPETEELSIRKVMQTIRAFCDRESIVISGGQTEVLAAVEQPVLCLTVFGTVDGLLPEQSLLKKVKPQDTIVMSKFLAAEGTWWMVRAHEKELSERFSPGFLEAGLSCFSALSVKTEALAAKESGAVAMHDVSRGGLFAALWELASREGLGIRIFSEQIPIHQETIEYCEHLGLNPYSLSGTGSLLMVAEDGEALVQALAEAGVEAAVIGHMTADHDKVFIHGDEVRNLEPPAMDEKYRV